MRTFISDSVVSIAYYLSTRSPFTATDCSALRVDVPFSTEAGDTAFISFIIPFSVH